MKISATKQSIGLVILVILLFPLSHFVNQYILTLETSNAVTVKFVGFQHGDYQHAVFETSQGEIISVFTRGEGCFLALNRAKILLVNFLEEEMYIPEAGGYLTVTVVKSVRTVDGSKFWTLGMGSKNYDQKEREKCGKIQAEFIYSDLAQ